MNLLLLLGLLGKGPSEAYFQEGRTRYAAGDHELALRAFEQSFALEPVPTMLVNMGQCLRALGRTRDAMQMFQNFLETRWGTRNVRAEVWEALDELRVRDRAAVIPAAQRDPAAAEHFRRGRQRYAQRDYEQALAEFRAAYLAAPMPAMLVNIAQCLRKLDRPAEAVSAYQSFLDQPTGTPRVRGEVWEALDDLLRELDGRMFRLASSSVRFRAYLKTDLGTPELRMRVAATNGEILTQLVRIDEQMSRPLDVRAMNVVPLSPTPPSYEARRPVLRVHGHRHAKARSAKRSSTMVR